MDWLHRPTTHKVTSLVAVRVPLKGGGFTTVDQPAALLDHDIIIIESRNVELAGNRLSTHAAIYNTPPSKTIN